jgi:hypothetical protein
MCQTFGIAEGWMTGIIKRGAQHGWKCCELARRTQRHTTVKPNSTTIGKPMIGE